MAKPLIKDIKIQYFRSVYDSDIRGCKPLNVIVGSNDSGKSNILRALNLFFNDETDSQINEYGDKTSYGDPERDWNIDFSQARVEEGTASKKKKYIKIRVSFNKPDTYSSLPDEFTVTKQWNLNYEGCKTSYSIEKKKERFVNRILNSIQVNYVPAIKHRGIFSYYLKLLHDVLIDNNSDIKQAFSTLQPTIQNATQDMSAEIRNALEFNSQIVFPADLSDIFGTLDFSTQASNGLEKVSLIQRGDGIQTRHLPYILDFITKKDTGEHYIWLYEEPETSLELTQAFDLARSFSDDFSQRNQIFITTHSPAFYSLNSSNVIKYQVKKTEKRMKSGTFAISNIHSFASLEEVDESLGLTKLVTERAKELYDELNKLKQKLEELKNKHCPLIICEGKTDIQYIKKAFELFGKQAILTQCEFLDAGGCDKIKAIIKAYNENPLLYPNEALCVFDCDVQHIPKIDNLKIRNFKLKKQNGTPLTKGIENLLSLDVAAEIQKAIDGQNSVDFYTVTVPSSNDLFKQVTKKELDKTKVADFVCNRNAREDFGLFMPLINDIEAFLQTSASNSPAYSPTMAVL